MISIDEINKTILDLEQHDTTFAACEKLAWLYIVKDHIGYSCEDGNSQLSPINNNSEFLSAVSNVEITSLLNLLNEHMEVVKIIMPKEYESLITKIKELA